MIIGLNPYKEDKHIWQHIQKTKAKIALVGRKSGFAKLKKMGTKKKLIHLDVDFENSVSSIDDFII